MSLLKIFILSNHRHLRPNYCRNVYNCSSLHACLHKPLACVALNGIVNFFVKNLSQMMQKSCRWYWRWYILKSGLHFPSHDAKKSSYQCYVLRQMTLCLYFQSNSQKKSSWWKCFSLNPFFFVGMAENLVKKMDQNISKAVNSHFMLTHITVDPFLD